MERAKFEHLSDASVSVRALAAFAMAVLVGLGVGGTAYRLAIPGGWLAQLLGRSLPGSLAAILAFLVIAFCFWLMREWILRSGRDRYADLLAYLCAGAGVLYALQTVMAL